MQALLSSQLSLRTRIHAINSFMKLQKDKKPQLRDTIHGKIPVDVADPAVVMGNFYSVTCLALRLQFRPPISLSKSRSPNLSCSTAASRLFGASQTKSPPLLRTLIPIRVATSCVGQPNASLCAPSATRFSKQPCPTSATWKNASPWSTRQVTRPSHPPSLNTFRRMPRHPRKGIRARHCARRRERAPRRTVLRPGPHPVVHLPLRPPKVRHHVRPYMAVC